MMTGSSSLKSTNNVSFDKMLSREQVNASDEDRVHGGRFLYMPKSEFITQGKKKFEFNFNKQQSRNPDKFLGTDLKKARAFTTPESDLEVMKYQVGKTSLRHIPLSPDNRKYFRKPLQDHSINFEKGLWRDCGSKPKSLMTTGNRYQNFDPKN